MQLLWLLSRQLDAGWTIDTCVTGARHYYFIVVLKALMLATAAELPLDLNFLLENGTTAWILIRLALVKWEVLSGGRSHAAS